jgi:hypothetical protein
MSADVNRERTLLIEGLAIVQAVLHPVPRYGLFPTPTEIQNTRERLECWRRKVLSFLNGENGENVR